MLKFQSDVSDPNRGTILGVLTRRAKQLGREDLSGPQNKKQPIILAKVQGKGTTQYNQPKSINPIN